ncbi:glycosyltransferase [Stenotrophomonas maltophilia]|nr:glycosyltransferase [Stenotrophomonas maltophilia]
MSTPEASTAALAAITESPRDWLDSVRSLLELRGSAGCEIAAWDNVSASREFSGSKAHLSPAWTLSSALAGLIGRHSALEAVLIAVSPAVVPPELLQRGIEWMRRDPRIATVSFLSNAAGALSFPHRNSPTPYGIAGMDEAGVCRVLRDVSPDSGPVSLQVPMGPVVLVNVRVIRAIGGFDPDRDSNPSEALAEFALRTGRRGFRHVLDAASYVTAQWASSGAPVEASDDPRSRQRLHATDSCFPALHDHLRTSQASALAIALDVARSKVQGLRVLIDGSCLGPMEMGTQVQTLALVRSLLKRDDVSRVVLAVPGAALPVYARDLLLQSKLAICDATDLMFRGAEQVDILHRPFQPDRPIPWDRWRQLSKRIIVTLQDLIAYRVGSYHETGQHWLEYRNNIEAASRYADAIVAISDDTRESIIDERLAVELQRIHVVKNGGDHLTDTDVEQVPQALVEKGLAAAQFLLVLGASYSHKNRDLAIHTWKELRRRGHNVALVMAGAVVAKGASRQEEAVARRDADEDHLVVMPDVSSAVRNWLLRHASIVLYPTSAEGFGLVPFEAASMGTPTAHVSFGPLRELIDSPELPQDWNPVHMADYCQQLLQDPALAEKNIKHVLASGSRLVWAATAADLTQAYRQTLATAPRA